MLLIRGLFVVILLSSFSLAGWAKQAESVDIGSRRELFIDDLLIDQMTNARLELHHPVPREVVLVHDQPWEGSGCGYHQIFQDEGRYRLYYRGWQIQVEGKELTRPHIPVACYAESLDGIHWVKPELGLIEFEGSKKNNIVWDGAGYEGHDLTPFIDSNPAATAEEKYKALAWAWQGSKGLRAFRSPDAIRWYFMDDGKAVMTKGAFDTQNIAFWDSLRKEYRAYIRDFHPHASSGERIRDIRTSTSKDFVNWTEPVMVSFPDVPDEPLYTNQVAPYYRAPHIFIGFPVRYSERAWDDHYKNLPRYEHRKGRTQSHVRYGSAITDTLLMSSRDGHSFKRWGESFLRPGPQHPNNWAYGDNYMAWHAVETASAIPGAPKEISLYATESYWTGKSDRLRRYTLRVDGFVSVTAPMQGGELLTRPLIFAGGTLEINFSSSAAGSIRIEVQDSAGRALEGFALDDSFEIFGDQLDRVVEWKSGAQLGPLAGKPVRLRFVMKDADLYSLRFR